MNDLKRAIEDKLAELNRLRPLRPDALRNLTRYFDIELTFTSNAIEGNTLTLRETSELIEHGITVGGKPLNDHLEAEDHHQAVLWMRDLAAAATPLGEGVIAELHRRIVARSRPQIAGLYSDHPRRIAGSAVVFPNPAKVPHLMAAFGQDLSVARPTCEAAFVAHFRLTAIHPFSDGNGRTARLLMNLMLLRAGYPPIAVRPVDRPAYLDALQQASLTDDLASFQALMHTRLDETLDAYIETYRQALPGPTTRDP